jgi:2-polyprenyl-3-methyl-5-hydroxy-6-metoxy-1,4-benzoquinol methylase
MHRPRCATSCCAAAARPRERPAKGEKVDSGYLGDAYETKDPAYFGAARTDYVDLLPADPAARVLEIGCGNGATGALARARGKAGEYVGIEMFPPMAAEAERVLTRVHLGDVAQVELPYPRHHFDALIMSEVLEHLVDPDAVLARLVPLVRPGGLVMASSPNVSHWRIVAQLLRGRFDYQEAGPMDRTHLRWFTVDSYARMFRNAGVAVESIGPMGGETWKGRLLGRVIGPLRQLRFYQINMVGRVAARP